MFGSEMLEVAIGVIFVFILVSIICAAIREGIEAWLKTRAAYLEFAIRELLHDRMGMGLANTFYNHPLVYGLYAGEYPGALSVGRPLTLAKGAKLPSYVPSTNFALALMDIAARGPDTDAASSESSAPVISLESIRTNILNLQNPAVQRMLLTAIDSAQGDLNRFQAILEEWYNSAMDRISGMYKRSTQWIILGIGLFVAVGLNINTIAVTEYLYRNDAARDVIVAAAEAAAADPEFPNRPYTQAQEELGVLQLPIGWSNVEFIWSDVKFSWLWKDWTVVRERNGVQEVVTVERGWWTYVLSPLFGWFLTAMAATLGAPFWFDVLNKVMVIRSTVKPHEKSPEEASEDRQLPTRRPTVMVAGGVGAAGGVVGGGGAPAGPGVPAPAAVGVPPSSPDPEGALDGCDVAITDITPDEDLPAAEGGVA